MKYGSFEEAYTTMLTKIQSLSPGTEIILINLPSSKLYSVDSQYSLNQVIRKCANQFIIKSKIIPTKSSLIAFLGEKISTK